MCHSDYFEAVNSFYQFLKMRDAFDGIFGKTITQTPRTTISDRKHQTERQAL